MKEQHEQKNKRGGARKGAGRKPASSDGKPKPKSRGFRLRSDILERLIKMDNATYYVETALLEKFERDGIIIE